MTHTCRNFVGAKIALFIGADVLVLHRDDRPGLLWAGYWDLPGGGREGGESPMDCVLRETFEEFALTLVRDDLVWARSYSNSMGQTVWFFVGQRPAYVRAQVRLGGEGQGWGLMTPEVFLGHDRVVPQFKERLRDYRAGVAGTVLVERPPAMVSSGGR